LEALSNVLLDFGRERAKVLLRERSQQFQGQGKDHLRGSEPREPLLGGERAEHLLGGEGTEEHCASGTFIHPQPPPRLSVDYPQMDPEKES
jgi:hypothetical protein